MKPHDEKRNGGPKTAATHGTLPQEPDALGEVVNFLRGQWLRHYVLFSALGSERDRERMAMLARFVDAVQQARCDLLPPWLTGNELLSLAREGKKEVRA
ncbi:MAG: hypothetical protein FGM15_07095 [Chthoniobacterales bacterium]|nr:hypothetical protein [Chthoniobacterales bacterium]